MATVLQMVPKTCPRCSAPTQTTPLTPPDDDVAYGCSRCTWPNPSWCRMQATLAKAGPDGGFDLDDQGLEDFAASIKTSTTLRDTQGRVVEAKVVEVAIHDGQVDVTFEFDPTAWAPVH